MQHSKQGEQPCWDRRVHCSVSSVFSIVLHHFEL